MGGCGRGHSGVPLYGTVGPASSIGEDWLDGYGVAS